MKDFMKINENDNVIVALKEMKKGEKISLENTEIEALETIPAGHKMAVKDICEGADVPHRYCEGRYQSGTVGSHAQYQNCTWRSAGIQI